MHTHIIENLDLNLRVVVFSPDPDPDLSGVLDQLIMESICHA